MGEVLITVVIPTYNRSQVITRAVNSVLNQSFEKWELLIVDDGSTDSTVEFLKNSYKDSRVKVLRRPPNREKGANACRNIGIENAKGQYIALLDSDDEWKSKHLENCFDFAEGVNDFSGLYSNTIIKQGPFKITNLTRTIHNKESYADFVINSSAKTPTLFFLTDKAMQIKFDESLQRHQDWDFFIRFGKEYSWLFNPSTQVVIHRSIKEASKSIELDSCIRFYEKYQDEYTSKRVKVKYLASMYNISKLLDDTNALDYYGEKLKTYGIVKNNSIFSNYYLKARYSIVFLYIRLLLKKIVSELSFLLQKEVANKH